MCTPILSENGLLSIEILQGKTQKFKGTVHQDGSGQKWSRLTDLY